MNTLAFIGGLQIPELLILLLLALLLFGSRLPSVGRNVGRSITEFKNVLTSRGDSPSEK